MSESDYQRGLRGGDSGVSISDYERWRDWKAGHDKYQLEQNVRDDEKNTQSLTLDEKLVYYDKRIKQHEAEYQREVERHQRIKDTDRENAYSGAKKSLNDGIMIAIFAFIGILLAGYILKWVFGIFKINIPVIAIWIIDIAINSYVVWESIKVYDKEIKKLDGKYGERR